MAAKLLLWVLLLVQLQLPLLFLLLEAVQKHKWDNTCRDNSRKGDMTNVEIRRLFDDRDDVTLWFYYLCVGFKKVVIYFFSMSEKKPVPLIGLDVVIDEYHGQSRTIEERLESIEQKLDQLLQHHKIQDARKVNQMIRKKIIFPFVPDRRDIERLSVFE